MRRKKIVDDGPPADIDAALESRYDERAMDAKIAQHVFGWKWLRSEGGHYLESMLIAPERAATYVERLISDYPPVKRLSDYLGCPKYSTDAAAAFAVADKLVRFQLSRVDCGGPWLCRSAFNDAVEAETAPMAICLAALRAKGIEWKPGAETA